MKGLDLSKFTKVGSKDGKTTFKHKDGHWLSVAHKSLSEGYRKQIESLPSYNDSTTNFAGGGGVHKEVPTAKGQSKAGMSLRSSQEKGNPYKQEDLKASKGLHRRNLQELKSQPSPKLMASGGTVSDTAQDISKGFNGAMGLPKPAPKMYAEGTDDGPVEEEVSPLVNYVKMGGTGAPEGPAQGLAEAQGQEFHDTQVPQEAPQRDVAQEQPGEASQDVPSAPTAPATGQPPQTAASGPQAIKELLSGEAQKMESDLAQGHIKPETYKDLFAKKDTLGKIGTIFGMLVGGGLRGSNVAVDMMDKEIQRDLDAQKASASNAHSYLSLVQNNPVLASQVKKLGADTKAVNQATAYTAMMQTSFHDQLARVSKMPPGPQKDAAMQALQAVYQGLAGKVVNAHDAASAMTPSQGQEQVSQPGAAPQGDSIAPLLHSGASKMMQGAQFSPIMEKDYPQIREQFTQAQQADKALANLKNNFDSMTSNATNAGRTEQEFDNAFGDIPLIGGALNALPKAVAESEQETRQYKQVQKALQSDIVNALKGTNISGDEIKDIVHKTSPVKGDSPEQIRAKRDTLEGFIKRSVPTSMLEKYHLLGK